MAAVALEPEQSLTSAQRRQLYSHSLVATVLLKRHREYTPDVVRAIAEHHENLNGSGYPRNLTGDDISPLGRVLALAEVVAAMFGADRQAPEMRLSVLLRMNMHRYDARLVAKVMHLLRPDHGAANALNLVMDDPVTRLHEVESAINDWPTWLVKKPGLSSFRIAGFTALAAQSAQLQRTLATVGVTRTQLLCLGDGGLDDTPKVELSLLAMEATWQLRALARQTRRRWRAGPSAVYPDELTAWLDRVDAIVAEGAAGSP